MAIIPENEFAGKIDPADSEYPLGKARNVTVSGDGTGTPWTENGINDDFGFKQALLTQGQVTPNSTPDTAENSQYLKALQNVTSVVLADMSEVSGLDSDHLVDGVAFDMRGWLPSTTYGGGKFLYVAAIPKSEHDGGVVISPTVPWDPLIFDNFRNAVGETDPSGDGVLIRAEFISAFNVTATKVQVDWWGAVRDGVANDLPAAQAAVDFVKSKTSGGVVKFARRVYRFVGDSLNLKGDNIPITLKGDSTMSSSDGSYLPSRGTLLFRDDSPGSVVSINTLDDGVTPELGTGTTGVTIKGIAFNGDFTKTHDVYGITGTLLKHAKIEDCTFAYCYVGIELNRVSPAVNANTSAYCTFRRCFFRDCRRGFLAIRNPDDVVIESCGGFSNGLAHIGGAPTFLLDTFVGFDIEEAGSGLITGCHFVDMAKSSGAPTAGSISMKITDGNINLIGNHFEQNYRDLVLVRPKGGVITGNEFNKGAVDQGYGIEIQGVLADELIATSIERNVFGEYFADTSTYTNHIACNNQIFKELKCEGNIVLQQTADSVTPPARGKKWAVEAPLNIFGFSDQRVSVATNYLGQSITYRDSPSFTPNIWKVGDITLNSDTAVTAAGRPAYWRCVSITGGVPAWEPVGQIGVMTSISATPSAIGLIAVVGSLAYISIGTGSPADWTQIN